jgi:hypothetical protein
MQVTPTESIEWIPTKRNTRGGKTAHKFLREAELLPNIGYHARLVRYEEGEDIFTAPRHRHEYDQIRFTLAGDQDFGRGLKSPEGTVGYFPAGAYYGPERIVGADIVIIQWGDAWVSRDDYNRAVDELSAKGEFREGVYHGVNDAGKRFRRDSITAVWEHVYGRRLEYPKPRYPQPILMDQEAFDWVPLNEHVDVKCLGRFTEKDIYIAVVQWKATGSLDLTDERTQLLFSLEGDVTVEGASYGPQTAIWSDYGESVVVEGTPGTRAAVFGFPVGGRSAALARSEAVLAAV